MHCYVERYKIQWIHRNLQSLTWKSKNSDLKICREKHEKYAFAAEILSYDNTNPNSNPKRRLTRP